MTDKRKKWIVLITMIMLCISLIPGSVVCAGTEGYSDYDFSKIRNSWDTLSDEELNDYIGNNNDTDIYNFITGLSDKEQKDLRAKKTMLNNTISIDNEDGTFKEMPYYEWIMENGESIEPMLFRTRDIKSTFTSKSGYCFFQFVDANSKYTVKYKVTFMLDSTSNAESTSNDYTVASVPYTSGTNSDNTTLNKVTFAKKEKYMQKASTIYEVLGDGKSGKNSDGETVYRTAITPIFVLTVKVNKPAYTYGSWTLSDFTVDGQKQSLANGSRFNFREYTWNNVGETTFDAKVYHAEVTDTLTTCINILSCGFTVANKDPAVPATSEPENDTINVTYTHPTLKLNHYVNGGIVESTTYNADAKNPASDSVLYNDYYNAKYGLLEPATIGFSKPGYSPKAGAQWKNGNSTITWNSADSSYKATDLLDFEDGTYFESKTRALYVNWIGNVYQVILDNQGADEAGTENTWYRYNTYETVTKADGSTINNYFYTSSALSTALKNGNEIEKPVKAGYVFKGYFSEKNGSGIQYVSEDGKFINDLWKTIGPHTIYAHWEKEAPKYGKLIIKRDLSKTDYYGSHGDAAFLFKVTSKNDPETVYYRHIVFEESDMNKSTVTMQTECTLPYGEYTVEALDVYRFENILADISDGIKVSDIKGEFELNGNSEEVTAVYSGARIKWDKFSHNDLVINSF